MICAGAGRSGRSSSRSAVAAARRAAEVRRAPVPRTPAAAPRRGRRSERDMGWEEAKGVKIVTKNFGVEASHKLDTYRKRGGWQAFAKAIAMAPAALIDEVKKS